MSTSKGNKRHICIGSSKKHATTVQKTIRYRRRRINQHKWEDEGLDKPSDDFDQVEEGHRESLVESRDSVNLGTVGRAEGVRDAGDRSVGNGEIVGNAYVAALRDSVPLFAVVGDDGERPRGDHAVNCASDPGAGHTHTGRRGS